MIRIFAFLVACGGILLAAKFCEGDPHLGTFLAFVAGALFITALVKSND